MVIGVAESALSCSTYTAFVEGCNILSSGSGGRGRCGSDDAPTAGSLVES